MGPVRVVLSNEQSERVLFSLFLISKLGQQHKNALRRHTHASFKTKAGLIRRPRSEQRGCVSGVTEDARETPARARALKLNRAMLPSRFNCGLK